MVVKPPTLTSETAHTLEPIKIAPKAKAKDDNQKAKHQIPHVPWAIENPEILAATVVVLTTLHEPVIKDRTMRKMKRVQQHTNKQI